MARLVDFRSFRSFRSFRPFLVFLVFFFFPPEIASIAMLEANDAPELSVLPTPLTSFFGALKIPREIWEPVLASAILPLHTG